MSAWRVSQTHIDALITAGLEYGLIREGDSPAELGKLLWAENFHSVNCHYGEKKRTPSYEHNPAPYPPAMVLKSIHCYEYQSCESRRWDLSAARFFCLALARAIIAKHFPNTATAIEGSGREVPGYNEAPWGL